MRILVDGETRGRGCGGAVGRRMVSVAESFPFKVESDLH